MDSEIAIDWQLPDRKIPMSFPRFRAKYDVYDETIEYLQALVKALITARSRSAFLATIEEPALHDAFVHFRSLDHQIGQVHRDTTTEWISESREGYKHPSRAMLLEFLHLPSSTSHNALAEAMAESAYARCALVFTFTLLYGEAAGLTSVADQEALYNSYDHSIDPYITASAAKMWHDTARQRRPGRNDGPDEYHLLYLAPDTTLLTTDRKFATWVGDTGVSVRYEQN
jgi:hypothetical protein